MPRAGAYAPHRDPDRSRRRGIALISVLWVLTLLSLVAASFTLTSRTEINLARNLESNARAEALADAGVYVALQGLLDDDPERTWRTDGTVYGWRFADGEIRIALSDEGGKIDLNFASSDLLRRLFLAAGEDEARAAALADAVVDFRDPNDLRHLNGAEDFDYRAAGMAYGAKDGPFDAVEELRQVL
ncbi:MAG: general secretion pathway protein GspK, partial [Alphaproteobacteria bacterium]